GDEPVDGGEDAAKEPSASLARAFWIRHGAQAKTRPRSRSTATNPARGQAKEKPPGCGGERGVRPRASRGELSRRTPQASLPQPQPFSSPSASPLAAQASQDAPQAQGSPSAFFAQQGFSAPSFLQAQACSPSPCAWPGQARA